MYTLSKYHLLIFEGRSSCSILTIQGERAGERAPALVASVLARRGDGLRRRGDALRLRLRRRGDGLRRPRGEGDLDKNSLTIVQQEEDDRHAPGATRAARTRTGTTRVATAATSTTSTTTIAAITRDVTRLNDEYLC